MSCNQEQAVSETSLGTFKADNIFGPKKLEKKTKKNTNFFFWKNDDFEIYGYFSSDLTRLLILKNNMRGIVSLHNIYAS